MKILTRHNSPDGGLNLMIVEDTSGRSVGFVDGRTETPTSIISEHLSRPTEETISQFVSDVLAGRHLLAVVRSRAGDLRDVFVVDEPAKALGYAQPDEEINLRYWDGTAPRIAQPPNAASSAMTPDLETTDQRCGVAGPDCSAMRAR